MATVPPGVAEYPTVNGLPLHTHAYWPRDLDDLYSTAPIEYNNIAVRHINGSLPRPGRGQQKLVDLRMVVVDKVNSDGAPQTGGLQGLRANIDELATVIDSLLGTVTLQHVLEGGGTRSAPCQVTDIQVAFQSRATAYVVLSIIVPGGVMSSSTVSSTSDPSASTTRTFAVPNDGSALQTASTVDLTGTATEVTLTNQSITPNPAVVVAADLSAGGVTVDTAAQSATQGGTRVQGYSTGSGLWLPLKPGSNTIQVAPTGGAVAVTLDHFPAFR